MKTRMSVISLILLAAGLLSACANSAAPTEVMMEKGADTMITETPTAEMMKGTPEME